MYNVYIVSYVKGTLFINSVPILSLVAAINFSQLIFSYSGLKWTLLDIWTFKFPGEGSPDFVIQVGINGCHTVILVPPSCSNVVPPFHNLTKAPICVVIKTLKWSVLSQQEMIIMHTFKWVILADFWWGIAFCAQNLVHIDLGKKIGV